MHRARPAILCAVLALATLTPSARDACAQTPPAASGDGVALPSLRRVLRHFDFEEAERVRAEFPQGFVRRIAEDRGFPPFGAIALVRDAAWTGRWSVRMDLDGGALSIATPTGILPVLPLVDYNVSVHVRTTGLAHARARLVATLHDAAGVPIPSSRTESALVSTNGAWKTLDVLVRGEDPTAVDLVVALEVVQPRQYDAEAISPDRPTLEDLRGTAWFDDLVIRHQPRIELTTDAPQNVIERPSRPRLALRVRDLTSERLRARIVVTDLDGRPVLARTVPAPRGRDALRIDLPLDRCGWYRATAEVLGDSGPVGQQTLDFVLLPPAPAPGSPRCERLAVDLPAATPENTDAIARLVRTLQVGGAIVPIWDAEDAPHGPHDIRAAQRHTIEALLADDLDLTFALERIPAPLARTLGLDREQVLETFAGTDAWRSELDRTLISFGLRVRRWQLGRADAPDAFWKSDLATLVATASSALAEFVPDPTVLVPFSAEQEPDPTLAAAAVRVQIPAAIRPAEFGSYLARWRSSTSFLAVGIEPLPSDRFAPSERATDLALRVLECWRADIEQMILEAPWRGDAGAPDAPDGPLQPDATFVVWRGIAEGLAARRFDGELPVAPGVTAWLMAGRAGQSDAVVLWRDARFGNAGASERIVLGSGAVTVRDVFGNTTTLAPVGGAHHIALDATPLFVEGIDLDLARFRAGFRVEPPLILAMNRVHEHEIILANPFPGTVSGTLTLDEPPGVRINPRQHAFVVRSGETMRLPVEISLDRNVVAGPRRLDADVLLTSERDHRMRVHATVEIGWPGVGVRASWRIVRNPTSGLRDLVITHEITNLGDDILNLDAFLVAPGVGRSRQQIAALAPTTSTTKTFLIPDGARRLAGATVQYGVGERDGAAQVNRLLEIPTVLGNVEPSERRDDETGP